MSMLSTVANDKRPFKGKGAEWLEKVEREYERIVYDMEELAEQSRRGAGSPWYVYMHFRRETAQHFLMWRSFGVKHVHLRWESMQSLLERMTESQRTGYESMNEALRLLNAKEKAARTALNLAKGLMNGISAHERER